MTAIITTTIETINTLCNNLRLLVCPERNDFNSDVVNLSKFAIVYSLAILFNLKKQRPLERGHVWKAMPKMAQMLPPFMNYAPISPKGAVNETIRGVLHVLLPRLHRLDS